MRQFISNEIEYLPATFHLDNLMKNSWNLFSEIFPNPNLFNVSSISITIHKIITEEGQARRAG